MHLSSLSLHLSNRIITIYNSCNNVIRHLAWRWIFTVIGPKLTKTYTCGYSKVYIYSWWSPLILYCYVVSSAPITPVSASVSPDRVGFFFFFHICSMSYLLQRRHASTSQPQRYCCPCWLRVSSIPWSSVCRQAGICCMHSGPRSMSSNRPGEPTWMVRFSTICVSRVSPLSQHNLRLFLC